VRLRAASVTTVASVALIRRRLERRSALIALRPLGVVLMRMRPLPAAARVAVPRARLDEALARLGTESVATAVQASLQLNS
jgi:hypothetical protein